MVRDQCLARFVHAFVGQELVWANLIVAVLVACGTLVVTLGKMPRVAAGACAIYIGLLALSPRQIGEAVDHISNNASYNRYCWALVCAIALAALLPGASRRRDRIDATVAGLMMALCFYIKVTYAAAGVGFVGLALITARGPSGWRFAALAGVVAMAVIAGVGVATGDLPGYFADMHTAVAVLPDTARKDQAIDLVLFGLPMLILAGLFAVFAGAGPDRRLTLFNPGLWAAILTVGAGLAIGIQNHPEPENPLLPVALVVGWYVARNPPARRYSLAPWQGELVILAALIFRTGIDLVAVYWAATAPVDTLPLNGAWATSPLADLHIGWRKLADIPLPPDITATEAEVAARWEEGIALLRPHLHGRTDATVLPFAWSNPFPLLLGAPPVRHEVAWWDPERTFNQNLKPAPHALLDQTDFVLIPRDYVRYDATSAMWIAYSPLLKHDFRIVAHTRHWDLWVRQDCARRGLC